MSNLLKFKPIRIIVEKLNVINILVVTAIILIITLYLWKISLLPTKLEIYVFNTNGTPSIFIRTPEDKRILINGGSNSEIIKYITGIIPFYSRYINTIIVTHDDGSTVSGLVDIINRYKVDDVILPSVDSVSSGISSSTDQIYQIFIDTVKQKGLKIMNAKEGDDLDLSEGKLNKLIAHVLFPAELQNEEIISTLSTGTSLISASSSIKILSNKYSTKNETKQFEYSKASSPEMVLNLVYSENSFLVLGNVSTKIQKYILNKNCIDIPIKINIKTKQVCSKNADSVLNSDVLIIPHSTSINLFAPNFVESVKPKYLIYSQLQTFTSKSKPLVDQFYFILDNKRFNIKQKNTVKVLSDGKSIEIK